LPKSRLQYWTLEILLIVGIIYLLTKISFLFEPIFVFASTLFFPILISGFLFFLFNPIVVLLEKFKIKRTFGILILYIAFIGLISLFIGIIGPIVSKQIMDFFNAIPTYVKDLRVMIDNFADSKAFHWIVTQDYVSLKQIEDTLTSFLSQLPDAFSTSISSVISVITNVTLTLVTVPFLLFYMLKDGHKMPNAIVKFLPSSYRNEGLEILKNTSNTLASYIQGQITVALFVGTLAFIGYAIIGLPYALILAMIVSVTNIIPYVGPFLGAAPAVVIGFFVSPTTGLLTILVILIAQQIEGNLLSPLIIGKKLDTHPATIIILLLVAGNLAGILGMILAIPVYAVSKTLVLNITRLVKLHRMYKQHNIESTTE